VWAGAGSVVFSNSPTHKVSTKGTGDGSDSSGEEGCTGDTANSSHDPHFEPIIDLPDTIEVRTGEEDETKGWYLQSFKYLCHITLHLLKTWQCVYYKYIKDVNSYQQY
jgi:hypothetical protein